MLMRGNQCCRLHLGGWLVQGKMLFYCLWISMPLVALGQTYYINFVFNNNRYGDGKSSAGEGSRAELNREIPIVDSETIELTSSEYRVHSSQSVSVETQDHPHVHANTDETFEDDSHIRINRFIKPPKRRTTVRSVSKITSKPSKDLNNLTKPSKDFDNLTKPTKDFDNLTTFSTTVGINKTPPTKKPTVIDQLKPETKPIETTTKTNKNIETTTPSWLDPKPHPSQFFVYPEATCHEDMSLHEVFGISLARDRGLPAKILCEFRNSWAGPWLLMTRMELPARVHMRHWFFGYLTDDYKDMNINFLALAHIINNMRLAMLIIGQNNANQSVYNLYDDVVISGFNDLFMLRRAHLVEANTTDLLYPSVGEVLESDSGLKRLCPFRVFGAWWGLKWENAKDEYCVFPVERDVKRPGYVAIFIKPSPFKVNNTAFYEQEITTRRPWAATINADLMKLANDDRKKYAQLKEKEFLNNKLKVKEELRRREKLYAGVDKQRLLEDKGMEEISGT